MADTDGSVVLSFELNSSEAEKDLARLKAKIIKLEDELSEKNYTKSALEKQIEEAEKAYSDLYKKIAVGKRGNATAEEDAALQGAYDRIQILQGQLDKCNESIASGNIALDAAKNRYGEISNQIYAQRRGMGKLTAETENMSAATAAAGTFMDKFSRRVTGLIKRVFVFSIITSALRGVREWLGKAVQSNDEATAAVARLKGALLTLAQPILNVVIPAFTMLVNILSDVVWTIARAVSTLFGMTIDGAAQAAQNLYDEQNAITGVGAAAKKASKYLSGLDEVRTYSSDTGGGGGSGSAVTMPDFTIGSDMTDRLKEISDLVLLIGGGLALWKISSMLPGTLGTISQKLGGVLLVVGGLVLAWNGLADAWENGVNWPNLIESIGGVAAAVTGLYLLFGKMGAGIGLVVGGLVMLVTSFHDAMESGWNLQNSLLAIAGLLATGLDFFFITGSVIPLVIAGIAALLLALTNATGHGEELIEGIQGVIQGFKDFFVGIFTGDIKKAISGLQEGVQGLKKIIFAVVDGVKDSFNSFLTWLDEKTGGKLHGIIEFVRDIVNGLFDFIHDTLGGLMDSYEQFLTGIVEFIAGVFTGDWEKAWNGIKDIFKGVFNAIIGFLENAMNLIIRGINWLIRQMNRISFQVPDWVPGVGGKSLGINIPEIGEISIPRLAQGAVIPPNKSFLAVLGDQRNGNNLEMPENLLRKIIREETRSRSAGGNSYEFVAQINRRTLFDEMITEAKLRQSKTGKNPLELA